MSTALRERVIVPARRADTQHIAALIDQAGEGIPEAIWADYTQSGQSPMAFGAERAGSDEGNFSWKNVQLLNEDGRVKGMLLAYRLPEGAPDMTDLHPLEVTLVELEALVPGSYYINAVAVYPDARGVGHGTRLMQRAEQQAVAEGCDRCTLIVFAHNQGALRLYRSLGYRQIAERGPVDDPRFRRLGACLLMEKYLQPENET